MLVLVVTVTVSGLGGFSSKSLAAAACCEVTRFGRPRPRGDFGDAAFFLDGDFDRERRLPGEDFRRLLGDDERKRKRAFF